MRRVVIVLLLAATSLSAAAPTGAGDASAARLAVGRGISVRLPGGWHLVRREVDPYRWSRRVTSQPAVMASFAVAFARHPCPCASPNYRTCGQWCEETRIRDFPQAGALVYVWEESSPRNPAALGRGFVLRPAGFHVAQRNPHFAKTLARELRERHRDVGQACVEGPGSLPTWWSDFRDAGWVFQVEVYLGPAAGREVLARTDALLGSLQVAPLRSSG